MQTQYSIDDKKQAEINKLALQVTQTTFQVEELQAVVNSLTDKSAKFSAFLTDAEAKKNAALANLNKVQDTVNNIKDSMRQIETATNQTSKANTKINKAAAEMSALVNQVIYSVEVINKLATAINKKKSSGAIISNDLVTSINDAVTDGNAAIAVTLTALESSYVALASSEESNHVTELEYIQCLNLLQAITGDAKLVEIYQNASGNLAEAQEELSHIDFANLKPGEGSLLQLLTETHNDARRLYEADLEASAHVTKQLEQASSQLARLQVELNSLEAGLAAAKAAALAA